MSAAQAQALLPYLILSGGAVALLLLVAWLRSHAAAFWGAVVVLGATLASVPVAHEAGTQGVDDLLRIDGYALFFAGLVAVAGLVTAVLSNRYLVPRAVHRQEFYILLVIAVLGAAVTAAAEHFAGVLLGIEVMSISLYAMIAYSEQDRPPLEAAAKYLVLSGAASSTMLFGMALVYLATGTLEFAQPPAELAAADRLILAFGQTMLLAGLFFKLSLVPFHMWTPDVYHGAPAPVTGFVATASKSAVFAVLLRYALDADLLATQAIHTILLVVAVLSMLVGNVLALLQTNLKRLLAYSSIAHLGYLLVAVVVAGAPDGDAALGVTTGLVYVGGYVLMTLAAFGVVTALSSDTADADQIEAYDGLFWRRPLLAVTLVAAALSLAGIPLTVGFIAKFYVIAAGVGGAAWLLVWAVVAGSAIGIYYYLRIVFAMTRRGVAAKDEHAPTSWAGVATAVALGVVIVALGVYPAPLIDFVQALGGP